MNKELFEKRKKIIVELINSNGYVPMKVKELAILLNIPKEERTELLEVLNSLISSGKIGITKKGKYEKLSNKLQTAVIIGNQRGFAFAKIEGEDEDVFIPENAMKNAMHGDVVQIVIKSEKKDGKRREGEVIRVIERSENIIVGRYQSSKSFGFVIPDNNKINSDIYIPKGQSLGAVDGHKVVVEITKYDGNDKKPEGVVKEIIGHVNDPGVDILSIIKNFNLSIEFPDTVLKEVEGISSEVLADEIKDREDLRDVLMVTIDGEDAKDLDDAISIKETENGYSLGVHIADVTHYVKENSPLDKEAKKRGTSVYLVDRVIPMLPHKLSNGICSLNASYDRLALSCIMEIDRQGKVTSHRISKSVLNINKRMSYTDVFLILEEKNEEKIAEYKELVPMFETMKDLAQVLREKRKKRGSIDFDFPESKIILDEKGKPVEIKPYERNVATKIIEEFMLLANETIAENFFWQELPFVYRNHETPDPEKMLKLSLFISNFGHGLKTTNEEIHPKELQKLLTKIDGTPEEALISRLTLRSMKQARYTSVCTGHFGLAAKYYTHFTSPIRRYPDLQIHRIIKESIDGKLESKRIKHYNSILPEVAEHSSITERVAEEAERDTIKLKKVEYMQRHLGEEFVGVVSGITNYGMYVELANTCEGMVHVNSMIDDYYFYNEETYEMIGKEKNKKYKLGQKVKIKVEKVDKILRVIDFILVEEEKEEEKQELKKQ